MRYVPSWINDEDHDHPSKWFLKHKAGDVISADEYDGYLNRLIYQGDNNVNGILELFEEHEGYNERFETIEDTVEDLVTEGSYITGMRYTNANHSVTGNYLELTAGNGDIGYALTKNGFGSMLNQQKGVANGLATLGSDGKISPAQVPGISTVIKNEILNIFYPVGTIYISVSPTNPGDVFGGSWVAFGTGRTLVGINASDAAFNTVEKTGGEKTHKLTNTEMPSHTHKPNVATEWFVTSELDEATNSEATSRAMGKSIGEAMIAYHSSAHPTFSYVHVDNSGAFHHRANTQYVGGNGAHNNLQPYITVYMWKRTA